MLSPASPSEAPSSVWPTMSLRGEAAQTQRRHDTAAGKTGAGSPARGSARLGVRSPAGSPTQGSPRQGQSGAGRAAAGMAGIAVLANGDTRVMTIHEMRAQEHGKLRAAAAQAVRPHNPYRPMPAVASDLTPPYALGGDMWSSTNRMPENLLEVSPRYARPRLRALPRSSASSSASV